MLNVECGMWNYLMWNVEWLRQAAMKNYSMLNVEC